MTVKIHSGLCMKYSRIYLVYSGELKGHLLEYSIPSFDYLVQRKIDNIHDDFAVAILDQKNGNMAGQEIISD